MFQGNHRGAPEGSGRRRGGNQPRRDGGAGQDQTPVRQIMKSRKHNSPTSTHVLVSLTPHANQRTFEKRNSEPKSTKSLWQASCVNEIHRVPCIFCVRIFSALVIATPWRKNMASCVCTSWNRFTPTVKVITNIVITIFDILFFSVRTLLLLML